jgi:hypothetical protein
MSYRLAWNINEDIDNEKLNWLVENIDELFSDFDDNECRKL